eukprot:TRINITY_DN2052_c0_g1_i1.p1 TRINITY_DN2052_c0_g1~~TRINITY_DN2052_c0_g1_i1.p1  ORF type:complete len:215 (+),score=61.52 TRINITY_DN2052_c0_g1_i1:339-983(+)
MRRIFGTSKPAVPPPTLDEANKRLDLRVGSVDEKIKKLDAELAVYKQQLAKARPGPAQTGIRQKAMRVLKQKKMYEAQRDQMVSQQFNMEQTQFVTQTLQDTIVTVGAMKEGAKTMKQQFKAVKIDDVYNLQDDLQDLLDDSNEIQEVLSRSYAVPGEVDEEDLDAELEALGEELTLEQEDSLPSYLKMANAPQTEPGEGVLDEYGLPAPAQKV